MQKPFASFNFNVCISDENETIAMFQEVAGLSASIETIDVIEGGVNHTVHKLIGHTSYSNVLLKRGLIDNQFANWVNDTINGAIHRKDIIISINDETGNSMSYKLLSTLPVKWNGPDLNVMQDSIATESIELSVEGIVFMTSNK